MSNYWPERKDRKGYRTQKNLSSKT